MAKTEQEKVADIIAVYQTLETRWAPTRAQQVRAYKYVIGDQLDKETRKMLDSEHRPAMVFNLMQNKVVTLAGTIENNHAYMMAVPITEGHEAGAAMHTTLVSDWAMKNCNGYSEIAKAAVDAGIAKIGWVNNYVDFRKDPQGMWITESFDPFMVMFDPLTRKKDLSDCKYLCVSAFYTADEITGIYHRMTPEMKRQIKEEDDRLSVRGAKDKPKSWSDRLAGITDVVQNFWRESGDDRGTITNWLDVRSGIYRVVEFHDRRQKVMKAIYLPQVRKAVGFRDIRDDESGEQYEAAVQQAAQAQQGVALDLQTEELWVTCIAPGLLPDRILYEAAYPVQGCGFQFKPIFCYDFHPDVTQMQSIMDVMIDTQDSYNQRRMSALEVVMDVLSPQWAYAEGSIKKADMPDWKSKVRGAMKKYSGQNKPEPIYPNAEGLAALKMLYDEDHGMADTLTGVTPNLQGAAETHNESGRLFAQRVKQSMVQMAYYMGNIAFSMSQIFTYCDRNLQEFCKLPRAVRVLNKTNEPDWLKLNVKTIYGVVNDVTEGQYDFVVDSKQVGETAKQMHQAMVIDMIQVAPPDLVPWHKVFQLFDMPDVDEWVQFAKQMMGMKLQQQQEAQKLQQQMGKLKVAEQAGNTVQSMNAAAEPPQIPETAAGG